MKKSYIACALCLNLAAVSVIANAVELATAPADKSRLTVLDASVDDAPDVAVKKIIHNYPKVKPIISKSAITMGTVKRTYELSSQFNLPLTADTMGDMLMIDYLPDATISGIYRNIGYKPMKLPTSNAVNSLVAKYGNPVAYGDQVGLGYISMIWTDSLSPGLANPNSNGMLPDPDVRNTPYGKCYKVAYAYATDATGNFPATYDNVYRNVNPFHAITMDAKTCGVTVVADIYYINGYVSSIILHSTNAALVPVRIDKFLTAMTVEQLQNMQKQQNDTSNAPRL